ncbi:MAG: hypothetical protein M1834_006329 [Cirrosporium novae-zelandiae]|nr:MAG: hypothetical protein M1834_006329 [Cirrosporium novae-zelandiae]
MILSPHNHPSMSMRRNNPNPNSLFPPLPAQAEGQSLIQYLLEPPLPSPRLPSLLSPGLPAQKRKSPPIRLILRYLLWIFVITVMMWYAYSMLETENSFKSTAYLADDGEAYEIIGANELPEEATPLVVTDKKGRTKWTVSIPASLPFPLSPQEYTSLCSASDEISRHVMEAKNKGKNSIGHFNYYHVDANFVDVGEAIAAGLLPGEKETRPARFEDEIMDRAGEMKGSMSDDLAYMQGHGKGRICDKSLTYVMETEDAGMGPTLMGLWMSYGLAKKEGRAFFIDDTNWAYGNYTTFFQPPPEPTCLRPPPSQILPCPHHAKHLLVSAATTSWTFGHQFNEYFENPRKIGVLRQNNIFSLLRDGYEALFHLSDTDSKYLRQRLAELDASVRAKGGLEVGVHVRHGDRHPYEFQYQESYIPLENYADEVFSLYDANSTTASPVNILLSSDDPNVYESPSFPSPMRAQSQIVLASKSSLTSGNTGGVDDTIGWEGGFFTSLFWSLGTPLSLPSSGPAPSRRGPTANHNADPNADSTNEDLQNEFKKHPTKDALWLRELVGRAYLLDLAVLGQSDKVVCAVSSVGCRILAVMMGWDKGIVQRDWRNVDGGFEWRGIIW